jgi:FkbM family methyltransferase
MKKLLILLTICNLHAYDPSYKFEGVFGSRVENIQNMNENAQLFLPYNPVIVEIGAFEGAGTLALSTTYPFGKIFSFEPHPVAYLRLAEITSPLKNVSVFQTAVSTQNGTATLFGDGPTASLSPIRKKKKRQTKVPVVVLDDWCKENCIDRIDFLRLDAGGLEWQILKSSPNVLNQVIVIVARTYMKPSNQIAISFPIFKKQMENEGFELLSHWYQEEKEGEATFVRKNMYDSIFR